MTTIRQRVGKQTKDQLKDRLIADARDQHDRDRRKAAEVARDKSREDKSREARRTKSNAPITVTAADGSTRLEDPTPAPASPSPRLTARRRRYGRQNTLPARSPRLTADQRRAQAEAEERAAEVERRRQIIVARAEAVTPLPYDNTGRPAVLETGSNR